MGFTVVTRTNLFSGALLLAFFTLAACDNVADQPAAASAPDLSALEQVTDEFAARGLSDDAEQAQGLLDGLAARYLGQDAQARVFGMSTIDLCDKKGNRSVLGAPFPDDFDVYEGDITGGTGTFIAEVELLIPGTQVAARLCIDSACQTIVEPDENALFIVPDVEAPATATFSVVYLEPGPPDTHQVPYRVAAEFTNDSCTP